MSSGRHVSSRFSTIRLLHNRSSSPLRLHHRSSELSPTTTPPPQSEMLSSSYRVSNNNRSAPTTKIILSIPKSPFPCLCSPCHLLPLITLCLMFSCLCIFNAQPAHAAPSVPLPFRRYFFFSVPQPSSELYLPSLNDGNEMEEEEQSQQMLTKEQQQQQQQEQEKLLHHRPPSEAANRELLPFDENNQSKAAAASALRGGIPMGPFDQWKRGGDFCGCNMGCFYHSVGQCASCCSLGL